ncbi:hypothetical protein H9651_10590 [Microbacterium sp. Sa4CUA7]|uniref:Flp pilus-assembly TadG-like N-terminal domain-containing protein n=1 Tax=Microbacterium pullorum TaxID=2762236 RepID=A0ABR8S3M5_9MICO|nr:polymer-forming cytoskeletal protein [Microbacterium pullorum]MBD7958087.1 hypothetical protein [Microbacterium pullorum]
MRLRPRPIGSGRCDDDAGSTLVSMLIVMLVLSIGGLVLSSIVVNTSAMLVEGRESVQSRAAADAGLAEVVARGQRGEDICSAASYVSTVAPRFTVEVLCDSSRVLLRSAGRGADGGSTVTEATYQRNLSTQSLKGAVISASGSLNVSSINITAPAIDGDIVLDSGDFDCNNSMEIFGDLIVRDGAVNLSNQCRIHGDVIASRSVQIQNNAVGVDGDVHAMGDFTLTTSATIGGSVYTRGKATVNSGGRVVGSVTAVGDAAIGGPTTHLGGGVWAGGAVSVNAATVSGSVTAAGSGDADFFNSTTGSVRVAGKISQMQGARINGDVTSSRPGVAHSIAPGTTITGSLTLAGTYSTWSSGPTVHGTVRQNVGGLVAPTAPTVDTPWALTPGAFEWVDLAFPATGWPGYTRIATPGCDYQNSPADRAMINALTAPTIVDARTCSTLKLYDVAFAVKTNVTFLVSSVQAQKLKVTSADGAPHAFNIITPDGTPDHTPTCAPVSGFATPGTIDIGDVVMDARITGLAYSPCTVHIGQSTGGGRWNGQVYAGKVTWGGNSSPRMQLDYREVTVPGFAVAGGGGGGGAGGAASVLGDLIRLRDT